MDLKFWLGDEYSGFRRERAEWIVENFPETAYKFTDEGYLTFDRHVVFYEQKDAILYKLRWD